MVKVRYSIALSLFFVLTMGPHTPCTQDQKPTDEVIKLGTELVVLDALVIKKSTQQMIPDLKKTDFELFEDGIKQELTHFSQDKLPLSIVLMFDTSGSMYPYIDRMRDGAAQVLRHLKPEDEVAVMATATNTEMIRDYSKNRDEVARAIKILDSEAYGNDGIYINEAIFLASRHSREASNPVNRRVVIVLTDDLSTQPRFAFHSKKEAIDEVRESGAVICGLMPDDFFMKTMRLEMKLSLGSKLIFAPGSINDYSTETGGEVLRVKPKDVDSKLAELFDRLRTRYNIGYSSTNQKKDGKFRRIKLKLAQSKDSDIVVKTRQGYYASH